MVYFTLIKLASISNEWKITLNLWNINNYLDNEETNLHVV